MKIKIEKWEDLLFMESEDQWGNSTQIGEVSEGFIEIATLDQCVFINHQVRRIYTDAPENYVRGGIERVLAELKMCGFDVEIIEEKEIEVEHLTEKQKIELTYFKEVLGYEWLTKDKNGEIHAFAKKPEIDYEEWFPVDSDGLSEGIGQWFLA